MWECPKCKESVHDHNEYCWNCKAGNPYIPGNKVHDPAERSGGNVNISGLELKKKCPFCAEEIMSEAIKCRFCGSVMPEARSGDEKKAPPATPSAEKRPDDIRIPRKIAVRALMVVCAVLAIGIVAVLFRIILNSATAGKSAIKHSGKIGTGRGGYEEIIEYDRSGKVINSTRRYDNSK